MTFKVSLSWSISLCKKPKILVNSFHRYWLSQNPGMWFNGRLFWSFDWNSMYHVKGKKHLFKNNLPSWTIFNLVILPRPIKGTLASLGMFGNGWTNPGFLHSGPTPTSRKLRYWDIDIDNQRILQSYWTRVFWPITCESKFS